MDLSVLERAGDNFPTQSRDAYLAYSSANAHSHMLSLRISRVDVNSIQHSWRRVLTISTQINTRWGPNLLGKHQDSLLARSTGYKSIFISPNAVYGGCARSARSCTAAEAVACNFAAIGYSGHSPAVEILSRMRCMSVFSQRICQGRSCLRPESCHYIGNTRLFGDISCNNESWF